MPVPPLSRRSLLCSVAALAPLPHVVTSAQAANSAANKNSRLGIGAIGLRYQGSVIANKASIYGDVNLDRPPRVGKLDAIVNHMRNFFDCVASRCSPVSDVVSQHRSASTCHLGNISMRLGPATAVG